MNIRQPENPSPADEPCVGISPGYFAPTPTALGGPEWRLNPALRTAAQSKNVTNILTEAAVAQCQNHLTPSPFNLGMAFAELAVTGRVAFDDFSIKLPQVGGPIQAAALAKLTALGTPGVTPQLVATAMSEVLDRAYQVAWFLRAQTARGNLQWIAVSGEDDLPHRPVNVPGTMFPQHDLIFTVPGDSGAIPVRTRYAIATASNPVLTPVSLPQRSLPAIFEPALPPNDRIILFIHGSDSRLEEANDLIPKLVRTTDGRPSGFTVISMDLPGSGYVNQIDHTEVGPWTALTVSPPWPLPKVGVGSVSISLLPFLEKFIVNFVSALSSRLGQPGLVESRIAAVIGGSLGGNLALRLARRPEKWLRNAVAYSPGSVWQASGGRDFTDAANAGLLQDGVHLAMPSVGEPEDPSSREQFFAGAFDRKIPVKTQPDQWYRDSWLCKTPYINNARLDRREIYTPQYRKWHWRVSIEELLWSWKDPAVQNFKSRLLLGAGSYDDITPANIYTNARKLADQLPGTNGDTFFFENTGHSIHAERPAALARKVAAFLTMVGGGHKADDYDGDGKSDFAVWRPTTGDWHVIDSSTGTPRVQQWGQAGDIPVPGDYDGDGKTDFAVWRPSEGNWYVISSSTGAQTVQQWGQPGDIPVPGDYDGDGKTDFAVWRPGAGTWHVIDSSTGTPRVQQWGQAGDIPVPGDYDGDGKTDFAVWRPSEGNWYVINSSTGARTVQHWGQPGDIPVQADYNGAEYGVWRPKEGNWHLMDLSTKHQGVQQWGQPGDIPVPGDFDGDSKTDFVVWRPNEGTWHVIDSSANTSRVQQWGQFGDIPLPWRPALFQMAPTPTIKVDSTQGSGVMVHIIAAGATIYYTTDGTSPNPTSSLYAGAFEVLRPAAGASTVSAVAVVFGQQVSAIASAQVTALKRTDLSFLTPLLLSEPG